MDKELAVRAKSIKLLEQIQGYIRLLGLYHKIPQTNGLNSTNLFSDSFGN